MIDRPLDGLGASDAAAILGVSRWKSPLDVFNEKMGITQSGPKEEHQQWGLLLEDAISARYVSITNKRVRKIGLVRSKEHPLLYAHPDRIVIGEPGLVEIKMSRSSWDEVPIYYKTQAIQQMMCSGREWVDFAVLVFGQRFLIPIPRVERDRSIEADFAAELEEWWQRHIVGKEPPAMDGGDAGRRYLRAMYPLAEVEEIIATTPMLPTVERYRMANQNRLQAERAEEAAKQEVMRLIGDASVLSGPFGKVTWTRYDQHKTDWKSLAHVYRQVLETISEQGLDITLRQLGWDGAHIDDVLNTFESVHTNVIPSNKVTPRWKETDD